MAMLAVDVLLLVLVVSVGAMEVRDDLMVVAFADAVVAHFRTIYRQSGVLNTTRFYRHIRNTPLYNSPILLMCFTAIL